MIVIREIKEKQTVGKTVKGKIQAAPKELLRRGLLTGTEKLKGQLRDAAEGGRREDTEADRAQDTARMGARLAVDRLGRLALRRKKVRTWTGEAVSGPDAPEAGLDSSVPGVQAEPAPPPSSGEPVRIKTRENAPVTPMAGYGRADLPRAYQPVVKTKDACVRRQVAERKKAGRQTRSVPRPGEYIHADQPGPVYPTIRTKDNDTRHGGTGMEGPRQETAPRSISERSASVPSQAQERGRQRFVRERVQQTAAKRAKGQGTENIVPALTERRNPVDVSPQALSPVPSRTEAPSGEKAVWETRSGGNRSIKRARLARLPIGKPGRQKIKSSVESSRQAVQIADRSANTARQTARAAIQAQQRALRAAGEAGQAVAAMDRPVVKAAASALRGAVSAIRTAVAPLAAGGGAVIAVVLVLCLVAVLIMSPLGIFFGGEETGGRTMAGAVREINQEYSAKLEELKVGVTYDQMSLSGARAPWPEVLAVYAVKTTSDPTNGQEVVTMDDGKKELLKQVFWDMNELSCFTSTIPGEGDGEDTTTLHITVTAKSADEMADVYGFNVSQRQHLAELLSDDYRELWNAVLYGIGTGSGEIVAVALSQVGNVGGQPYWSWYGFSHRVNWCAIFVSWCADQCGYIDAGVVPKFSGCVQGSRWFKERGLWQDKSYTPNPGDIIFFDWDDPGGFSGPQDGVPDHVGIVEKAENGRVYTVEGNSGDKCCQRSYPVGYYEIYGYGVLVS